MELDVHLTREGEKPWGFEFVGGADFEIPLTIDKVFHSSPAQIAGLQPGDVVARLGDTLATDLSHEAACAVVAEAVGSLSFGICRGLYDPVVDDYEPIYEPIEQADSDQRSEPTEVPFPYQYDPNELSLDDPKILDPRITDPSLFDSGYATFPLTESRSLTSSPFVLNTKPYRPFSTEPLEVPPLDDPIVLNPNFKDTLGFKEQVDNVKELDPEEQRLLGLIPLEKNVESKFKLPVSEKFDPEWDRKVKAMLVKCAEGGERETRQVEHELVYYAGRATNAVSIDVKLTEEVKEMSKVSKEVKVEVVKAEEVKKEGVKFDETIIEEIDKNKIEQTAFEVVEESIERAVSVTEEIHKEIEEELRASMTRELQVEETESASEIKAFVEEVESKVGVIELVQPKIRQKSETEMIEEDQILNEKLLKDQREKEDESVFPNKKVITKKVSHTEEKNVRENKSSEAMNTETLKTEGKQNAFIIGLQTIPHIKGFVQSSYHFDLLLRTFFVHLTDVMVALSRFILTQPTTELEVKTEGVVKEKLIKDFSAQDSKQYEKTESKHEEIKQNAQAVKQDNLQETVVKTKQETKVAKAEVKEHKEHKKEIQETQPVRHNIKKLEDMKVQQEIVTTGNVSKREETLDMSMEDVETKKKSGAEMSQMTQRKSKDLTKKMDAVISEFETKTGIEDRLEVTERSRRSRSRSQIEEEVMKESDPLEWLDKVDKRESQERTDITNVKKGFSTFSESTERTKSETKRESRTNKVKPGKQMYVAIVESHVYTNKDAILEDQVAEISETASVQSSEEINAALESAETIAMENVAMSSVTQTEEKQQAVEVITNALQEIVQEKQEIIEAVTDFKSEITKQHSKSVMEESHTSVAAELTEIISDSKVETFKSKEFKEHKAVAVQEESYKTAAVEFVDVPLEATKGVVIELKGKKHEAVAKQELLTTVAAESTEIITDDSKLESFESNEMISKKARVTSEEMFRMAAVGSTEVTLEEAVEEHTELAKTGKATIREETQHLAVAGIIETKTEVCAEPKKPAEDEYASLKIVKEQIIDDDKSIEILSESEVNLKKSLQVQMSSSQQVQTSISQSQEHYQSISQEVSSSLQKSHKSSAESSKLHLRTDLAQKKGLELQITENDENDNTSSPSAVPPTPLTDEYVFRLEAPLPKNEGTIVVEDSSDREDLIVKKGLVPYIEATIEEQIIYDPPLRTPTEDKVQAPVYTKPGLRGGAAPLFKKEYIREIERKSSLLASAIDQTIKSIEEYKEEVGITPKKQIKTKKSTTKRIKIDEEAKIANDANYTNGFTNGNEDTDFDKENELKMNEEWAEVDIKVAENNGNIQKLSKETSKKNVEVSGNAVNGNDEGKNKMENKEQDDILPGFKTVVFNPEAFQANLYEEVTRGTYELEHKEVKLYVDETGEPLGTIQGIVDGLEDATVDEEVAKELGKPGLTDGKIAELISGESEMLREAHVMGLSRVLTSHMSRPDDSSVDFQKIKPIVESLKDSEVLKALNDDLLREKSAEKKKEQKKWTTFLQKPQRPVPTQKLGHCGYVEPVYNEIDEQYKVKIVKQPKPKVAPDYKAEREDFDTGPLPWEQRALLEPVPSPVPPEEPILIPEETPQFLEAVDPLPESEVPDLEDTGIPLPPRPPTPTEEPNPPPEEPNLPEELAEPEELLPDPQLVEEPMHDMEQNKMAEQLVNSVKSMVDPNAPLERQLGQMRAQLAALAQLPCVIQQSLEMLTKQLSTMSQGTQQVSNDSQMNMENKQVQENSMASIQEYQEEEIAQNNQEATQNDQEQHTVTIEEVQQEQTAEELATLKKEEVAVMEEKRRSEQEKKEQHERVRLEQESRQIKQRAAPRVGKPRPVFGPLTPEDRPVVLPGGRRWRGPKDAYDEQMIAETLQAQSEILQGKVLGYESDLLPYDDRQSNCHLVDFHRLRNKMVSIYDKLIEDQLHEVRKAAGEPGSPAELGDVQDDPQHGTGAAAETRNDDAGRL